MAQRVAEMGAGRILKKAEAGDPETLCRIIMELLTDRNVKKAAGDMRKDFLSCSGPKGAADFIEEIGKKNKR